MARSRLCEPHLLPGVFNAIPDPARSRDFVLPLIHLNAVDQARATRALQRVLPGTAMARLSCQCIPSGPRIGRRLAADTHPTFCGCIVCVADIPSARMRRWSNTLTSTRHAFLRQRVSARVRRTPSAVRRTVQRALDRRRSPLSPSIPAMPAQQARDRRCQPLSPANGIALRRRVFYCTLARTPPTTDHLGHHHRRHCCFPLTEVLFHQFSQPHHTASLTETHTPPGRDGYDIRTADRR